MKVIMNITKKVIVCMLIQLIMLFVFTNFVVADTYDTRDSAHNLTVTGTGDIKSNEGDNYCLYCHTPHFADPIEPLWNHKMSGQTYTLYDSSTTDARDIGQPNGTSALCLSCHDGTIAMGDVNYARSVGRDETITDSGSEKLDSSNTFANTAKANLGVNIANDHPISFVYDPTLAEKDEGLVDPTMAPSGLGDTINIDMLDSNSRLQCTSCHEPHDNTYGNFLIKDNTNGELCTTCHDKTGWATGNAHYDAGVTCNDCHTSHNANEPAQLKAATEEQLCYTCHDDDGSRYSEWDSIPDIGSVIDKANNNRGSVHPIEDGNLTGRHDAIENNDPSNNLPIFAANKHAECSDCHDPHQVTGTNAFAGVPGFDLSGTLITSVTNSYELCYKCHQGANGLQESIDSVKYTFDNRTYTHGNETNAEQCNKCHGGNSVDVTTEAIHGSNASGLLTKSQFIDIFNPSTSDLCLKCHDDATNGQQPKIYFTQAVGSQHNTKCTACHGDSVNYNNIINVGSETGVPHGSNKPSILKGSDPQVCLDCHSDKFSGYNTIHDLQDLSYDDGNNGQVAFNNGFTSNTNMKCTACHGNSNNSNQGSQTGIPHGSDQPKLLKNDWDPNFGIEGRSGDSSICLDCHDSNTYGINASQNASSGFTGRDGGENLHEEHNDFNCASCHAVHGANNDQSRSLLKDSASSGNFYDHGSGGDTYLTIINWSQSGNWGQDDCDHSGCG
ncbi:doubled CXXCH domain-containing protein [Candidatus Frackibacter sp. WG12]|nr:doubled CXXCH domain-containing protein [Candidatus Frackibacter sp. WG11]SEM81590.1 doubled CXXCH domain-containing protein [Candidatus Frackibacter sp. WG12]SFL72423.1 doubled CXXCH domain-containing protein [Candidatus Frackibacter sp. WG13]